MFDRMQGFLAGLLCGVGVAGLMLSRVVCNASLIELLR